MPKKLQIVHLMVMFLLIKHYYFSTLEQCLCCFICHSEISVDCEVEYVLTVIINISRVSCGLISLVQNSNKVGVYRNTSDLNRRFYLAMRCIGRGLVEEETFCGKRTCHHLRHRNHMIRL